MLTRMPRYEKQWVAIYEKEDKSLFGPVLVPVLPQDYKDLTKENQAAVKKKFKNNNEFFKRGKNRIMKKSKEIH